MYLFVFQHEEVLFLFGAYLCYCAMDIFVWMSALQATLMITDGCYQSTDVNACALCYDGVFTKGLHSAILVYADLLLQLAELKVSEMQAGGTQRTAAQWLNHTQWQQIQCMSVFMREGLALASRFRLDAIANAGSTYMQTSTALGVSLSCVFIFFN